MKEWDLGRLLRESDHHLKAADQALVRLSQPHAIVLNVDHLTNRMVPRRVDGKLVTDKDAQAIRAVRRVLV